MPILADMMKKISPRPAPYPAATRPHDGDEIYLAEAETRSRDVDLAILRALCS